MWGQAEATPVRLQSGAQMDYTPASRIWFRMIFSTQSVPVEAVMEIAASGSFELFVNGKKTILDSATLALPWNHARRIPARELLRKGKNLIAVEVQGNIPDNFGLFFQLLMKEEVDDFVAVPPGGKEEMGKEEAAKYAFPPISNFEIKKCAKGEPPDSGNAPQPQGQPGEAKAGERTQTEKGSQP
jgi:hypothetical protein